MRARTIIGAAACLLIAPAAAQAAGWVQVTAKGPSIDQVGLLRTADGKLHAAWHHAHEPASPRTSSTRRSPRAGSSSAPRRSSPAGRRSRTRRSCRGRRASAPSGAASAPPSPTETNQELNTSLSVDGGRDLGLQTGSVVPIGAQAYGSPVAAATLPDGTPLEAWAGTLGTWAHAGLVPDAPNHDFQAPLGNYGYDTGLATDAAGRAVLAWYSNATGHLGVYAQDVAADGSPVGSAVNMPGTANMQVGQIGRTPIVARAGGGFYVAYATGYPTQKRIRRLEGGRRGGAHRRAHPPRLVRHRRRRRQRPAVGGLGRRRRWRPPRPRPPLEPLRPGLRGDASTRAARARRSRPTTSTRARPTGLSTSSRGSPSAPASDAATFHTAGAARAHPDVLPPADPRRHDDPRDLHGARRRPAGEGRPREGRRRVGHDQREREGDPPISHRRPAPSRRGRARPATSGRIRRSR